MDNKEEKKSILEETKEYKEYFKDDLAEIDNELKKADEYSTIIDNEIQKLKTSGLGVNKGSQHYLIEHITNAIQLQSQKQSLRKDKFTIEKTIMDYSKKFNEDKNSSDSNQLAELVNKIIIKDRENKSTIAKNDNEDLDSFIETRVNKENN